MSSSCRLRQLLSALAMLALSFAWSPAALGHSCPGDSNDHLNVCVQDGPPPPALSADTKVFVVYWGSQWLVGFDCGPFFHLSCSFAYQNYLETFLDTILGTVSQVRTAPYFKTVTQYDNAGVNLERFSHAYTWIDQSGPPTSVSDDDAQAEVQRAQRHFGDNNSNIYLIMLPLNVVFPPAACGGHHSTTVLVSNQSSQGIPHPPPAYFAVIPFQQTTDCIGRFVNSFFDPFGHQIFDGLSIITGHELAETLTDPANGGFYDTTGNVHGEIGDKCQTFPYINIGAPNIGTYFAVQPLWSNADGTCLFGNGYYIKAPDVVDFGIYFVGAVSAPMTVNFQNDGTADLPLGGHLGSITAPFQSAPGNPDHCDVLHPGDSCAFQILFIADNLVNATETLTFLDNDGNTAATVTLKGATFLRNPYWIPPQLFGPTLVGPNCDEHCPMVQGMIIVNQDSVPHRISNISIGAITAVDAAVTDSGPIEVPDFTIANDPCSSVMLQPGRSCTVGIRFTPQTTGQRSSLVNFFDETGAAHSAALSGVGWGPAAQLTGADMTARQLGFPISTALGRTQVEQVILTAAGQAPLSIASIAASGDFTEIDDCPPVLALGSSCTMNVKLTSAHYGFQTGALTIDDDASDSPQVVQLSGDVTPTIALASPGKLDFRCQPVNVASDPLKLELATSEGGTFRVSSIMTSPDFIETNDCPSGLTSLCTISVVFKPTKKGVRTGHLTIFDNALNGIQSVGLSGIGTRVDDECEHMRDDERRDCEQHRRIEKCGETGD